MKAIETLLKLDTGCKFATPKKLNRSSKLIAAETAERLEAGEFTSEMIDNLAGQYPIFRYRTCITIHGNWPEVSRTRIGGYKNIHQNQNGSLEIYYSAIDRDKIQTIREQIKGTGSPFHYNESSTARHFEMYKTVTRETLPQVRAEMEPIARELAKLNIYGHINLYLAADLFRQYLVLSLHPLAIPQAEVYPLVYALSRLTKEEHDQKREEYTRIMIEEERARNADYEAMKQRAAQNEAAKKAEIENVFKPQVAHLKECRDLNAGILVGISNGVSPQINFVFYRKDGNGSFGRVKYSKAISRILDIDALQWKEQKQQAAADILRNSNTYYLLKPERKAAPAPRQTAATTGFEFKSEKVWADFNQRVAKLKGYPLPEKKEQTKYQDRQNGRTQPPKPAYKPTAQKAKVLFTFEV